MRHLGTAQNALSTYVIIRELALAADRSLWADDRTECITVIARIYELFDDLEQGIGPHARDRIVAADTAAWVGHMGRCAELLGDVVYPSLTTALI